MICNKKNHRLLRTLVLCLLTAVLVSCGEQRFLAPDAPDFTLPSLTSDQTMTLSDYRGEVVYLSFWASWCIPCRQEMPILSGLWDKHRDAGLRIIGINVDENIDAARQFAQDYDIEFPLVRDQNRAVSKLYRVAGYPSHYIVDRKGKVRFSAMGFTDNDALAVIQEVETLLAEPADGVN